MTHTFPIILDDEIKEIPYDLIAPHEAQALINHAGRSIDELSARGGISVTEALAVIEDRTWERIPLTISRRQLMGHVAYHLGKPSAPPRNDHEALVRLDKAIALAHRIRATSPVKHTANEMIAALEGLRIMLEGRP